VLHAQEHALAGAQPGQPHAAEADAGPTSSEATAPDAAAAPLPGPVDAVASAAAAVPPVAPPVGRGVASWYGDRFHGRPTASGEAFDMHALTAAHPTLPFGSIVRVRSLVNDRVVDVRINDRGPYAGGRIIDLSRAAAAVLGLIQSGAGTKPVQLNLLRGGFVDQAQRPRRFFNARRSSPPPAH
jgi:rare lipoprotein A